MDRIGIAIPGRAHRRSADATAFAGNLLLGRGNLSTLADPGILTEDGFETEVPALAAATPTLVRSTAAGKRDRDLPLLVGIDQDLQQALSVARHAPPGSSAPYGAGELAASATRQLAGIVDGSSA